MYLTVSQAMAAEKYKWWTSRLQHMSLFFQAFRIDHVLGARGAVM